MKAIIPFLAISISGCATQGQNTYEYIKGDQIKIVNEITVDSPYSQVWDMLVRDLAKSFYVINNIDKESRIINVSLTSTEAEQYVDCGRSSRTYTEGSRVESFNYNVASKTSFKVAAPGQEHPSMRNYAIINREPVLDARSNIYIAPLLSDPSKTTVSINTRYVITLKTKGEAFAQHVSGAIHNRGPIPEDSVILAFNTGTVATKEQQNAPTLFCFANGRLEEDVLSILK